MSMPTIGTADVHSRGGGSAGQRISDRRGHVLHAAPVGLEPTDGAEDKEPNA